MTEVSPHLFVDAVLSYQKTAAIKAAIELDLFTKIGAGAGTAEALAQKTGASSRGLRILCDFLTILGFLEKSGETYAQTPSTAKFINSTSPTNMSSIIRFIAGPEFMRLFLDDPVTYVRDGGTIGLANMAPDNPIWVTFARSMVPFTAAAAAGVAAQVTAWTTKPRKVLDIAAGGGMFGILIAKAVPDVNITALDWENVLEVTRENAAREGVAARYQTVAGSAFDADWGSGYDLILMPNFLHHFDHASCVSLLSKARRSIAPGGRVVVTEFVPNEDRVSPPLPATFAFIMLATTQRGDAFTASDLAAMARDAAYRDIAITPLPPSPESMVEFLI